MTSNMLGHKMCKKTHTADLQHARLDAARLAIRWTRAWRMLNPAWAAAGATGHMLSATSSLRSQAVQQDSQTQYNQLLPAWFTFPAQTLVLH